jgi:hypothetical protein
VGELGALRVAGRARGVEDHRGVLVVGVGDLEVGGDGGQQIGEAVPVDDDELGFGLRSARLAWAYGRGSLAGRVREPVPGEDQPGPGVAEVVGDFPPLKQRVHGDDHTAGPEHTVVDHGDLGDVGHHDPDPVTGPQTAFVQEAGHPGARLVQRPVGHCRVIDPHGHPSGVSTGGGRQVLGQVRHVAHCPAGSRGWSSVPGIEPSAEPWYRGTNRCAGVPRQRHILVFPARYPPVRPGLTSGSTPRKGPIWRLSAATRCS